MKSILKKSYLLLILLAGIIGFSTGIYLKYIKSYTGVELQLKSTKNLVRQPNLGETIHYMEKLKTVADSVNLKSNSNAKSLTKLKTINVISIALMAVSLFVMIGSIRQFLLKRST